MQLTNLLSEFWVYAHTKEYREGLFVEASGLVLDVLLLLVCVKLISYYLNRQSRSTTNFASSFFIAQFLREVLTLQLKSGGVTEINTTLKAALIKNELESLFSHFLYGNTENLFDPYRRAAKILIQRGADIVGALGQLDSNLGFSEAGRPMPSCIRIPYSADRYFRLL